MKIRIAGKNMAVGDSLMEYIEDKLQRTAEKYLTDVTSAEVVISKKSHFFFTDILIHESTFGMIKANGENDEVYASFDSTLIKLEKQLRKYKDKLSRKGQRSGKEENAFGAIIKGTKYVISSDNSDTEVKKNDEPLTIAEKVTDIETLTVSEAIMKMDLSNLPALLFKNKASGRLNIVYHRADGNISWVDPGSDLT